MSASSGPSSDLNSRVQQYLDERHRLGFKLCSPGHALRNFERFVTNTAHDGPLTVELMAQWARRQVQSRYLVDGQADGDTAVRRLAALRPFMRWLQQFEPATEVPDDSSFGPIPGRVTPHIYAEEEIVALLEQERGWKRATVVTLLARLTAKGALETEPQGNRFLYTPSVQRTACVAEETRSFLDRMFGGALRPLVAHCAEHQSLTKKDITELKALLDQIKPKS